MILVLDTVDKSIEAVLDSAVATNQPVFVSSYADSTASSFSEGASDGVLNSDTAVTVVSAPAASTKRVVKMLNIYNADTADVVLTLRYKNGADIRPLIVVNLQPGDLWTLRGVYDSQGRKKSSAIDVVDNLSSTETSKALSANQGKQLNDDKASLSETTLDMATDPNFTGGTMSIKRSGNIVVMRDLSSISHLSSADISTEDGFVPSEFIPPSRNATAVYSLGSSEMLYMLVTTAGAIRFIYRDYSGSLSARTNTGGGTVSYSV